MSQYARSKIRRGKVACLVLFITSCAAVLGQTAGAQPSQMDGAGARLAAPRITALTPSTGAVGTTVVVSGSNLTGASAVTFGGTSAAFKVTSSKSIVTAVPTGATTGPVTVTSRGQVATSRSLFTVTSAPTTGETPAALPPGIFVSPTGNDATGDGSLAKPFATLAKAQATMRLGGPQIAYIRAGYYALPAVSENGIAYGLLLTTADSGQTWTYYPPDGYNSAILDGGSTSSITGIQELITIDGASNVTINGLQLQHFRWTGIALHGGINTWFERLFPTVTPTAAGNTISNNVIHDGAYDTSPTLGTGGGAVYGDGNMPLTTVTNNVIYNVSAFGIAAFSGFTPPSGDVGSLRIANNVVFSVCLLLTDCGALYVHDENTTARNIVLTNNYVRDTGTATAAARPVYLDDGVSGTTVTNNIITGIFKWAFAIHGGADNTITSNIADMTDGNEILLYQARSNTTSMSGNLFQGNVIVSGGGGGWYEGGRTIGAQPTIRNNVYHQYAGSPVNSGGFSGLTGDTSPIFLDPQLSCWTYNVASSSPIFAAPVSFVPIPGRWGPPGYVIPQTGTPPSQPHDC